MEQFEAVWLLLFNYSIHYLILFASWHLYIFFAFCNRQKLKTWKISNLPQKLYLGRTDDAQYLCLNCPRNLLLRGTWACIIVTRYGILLFEVWVCKLVWLRKYCCFTSFIFRTNYSFPNFWKLSIFPVTAASQKKKIKKYLNHYCYKQGEKINDVHT